MNMDEFRLEKLSEFKLTLNTTKRLVMNIAGRVNLIYDGGSYQCGNTINGKQESEQSNPLNTNQSKYS